MGDRNACHSARGDSNRTRSTGTWLGTHEPVGREGRSGRHVAPSTVRAQMLFGIIRDVWQRCGELDPSCAAGEGRKRSPHCGKRHDSVSKKVAETDHAVRRFQRWAHGHPRGEQARTRPSTPRARGSVIHDSPRVKAARSVDR